MNSKLVFVLGLFLFAGLATARRTDEFSDYEEREIEKNEDKLEAADETDEFSDDETPKKEETSNDESRMVMEDMNAETSTALVQNDEHDPDHIKHKGFCHFGIAVWFKPGAAVRCGCLKCTCKTGGIWACDYEFAYCPYFYCGNKIYNPNTQICCCGQVHAKKSNYSCCGHYYYYTKAYQCCKYYSVKPIKATCPRYQ